MTAIPLRIFHKERQKEPSHFNNAQDHRTVYEQTNASIPTTINHFSHYI